jgi:hypothetical protein
MTLTSVFNSHKNVSNSWLWKNPSISKMDTTYWYQSTVEGCHTSTTHFLLNASHGLAI